MKKGCFTTISVKKTSHDTWHIVKNPFFGFKKYYHQGFREWRYPDFCSASCRFRSKEDAERILEQLMECFE